MDDLKLLKALKNKILSLAMQGKIVKQNENDEPASILLEKIKNEKAVLLKQGKLKKEKPLPPISADEVPYKLPKSWKWVRLENLVKYDRYSIKRGPFGSSITKSMFVSKSNNTFKIYEQGNAIKKTINYGTYYIQKDDFMNLKSFEVLPNDIIISCAGTMGECFIIPQNAPQGIINQALLKISLNPAVMNNNFFIYLFKVLIQEQIKKNAVGTAIKNMSSVSWLKNNVVFPLPPLAEQERIVAKIEEIFAIIDEIEKNIAENKKLSKVLYNKLLSFAMQGKLVKQDENDEPVSILLEKIKNEKAALLKQGKLKKEKPLPPISADEVPYELPKSYKWVRLGDVCEISLGKTPKRDNKLYWNNGVYPWIKIGDMTTSNKYLYKTSEKISELAFKRIFNEKLIPKGSLIFSFKLSIGKACILGIDALTNEAICTLKLYSVFQKYINYLYYILPYTNTNSLTNEAIKGKTLNSKTLPLILLPLPPLAEQERIVAKIEEIKEIIDEIG